MRFNLTDSNKNQQALNIISKMMSQCCWLNIHIVPPHGEVFEIRAADGYGARWTKDGTQVYIINLIHYHTNSYSLTSTSLHYHGPPRPFLVYSSLDFLSHTWRMATRKVGGIRMHQRTLPVLKIVNVGAFKVQQCQITLRKLLMLCFFYHI